MKRKKTNKFAVSNTAAAPVAEKTAPVEEAKVESAPVSEAVPVVEAPAPEVKETKSTPKKKSAAKKEEVKKPDAFVIQSSGKEYTNDDIVELCKALQALRKNLCKNNQLQKKWLCGKSG